MSQLNSSFAYGGKRFSDLESSSNLPFLSIITVVYNGGAQLRYTIESVLKQTIGSIEYIVIDGGSTDGTCDMLREFEDRLDYWVSEPDGGIYDAMNKAINLARGQFIYHLNIGDRLLCIPKFMSDLVPEDVICIAGVVQTSAHGLHIPAAGVALRFHNTMHHQGCFYRKTPELRYDLQYKVFSDFDLNQRLLRAGGQIILCPDVVAFHDVDGISNTTTRFFEVYSIICKNFGIGWVVVSYMYFKYRGLCKRLGLI